jgi:hypothetical protein
VTALRVLVVLAAGLACGCSALTPFPSVPTSPAVGVTDPRQRVGICFNTLKTSPEELQRVAQAECLGDSVAERVGGTDYWLDFCPLAVPGRATFACTPKK